MSVTLTGTGGMYTRLGIIFARIRDANLYLGATDISAGGLKTVGVGANNTAAQFASALQNEIDGLYTARDSVRQALSSWKSYQQTLALNTLIDQVHADATLVTKDFPTAYKELERQQIGSGTLYNADNDVDAATVSASVATVTGITNTGTGTVAASVKRPDGRNNELVFAEVMEVRVTAGAGDGATARSETASVKGENSVSDPLGFDWPGGSGASASLTAIDPALDASGNLLYNSDFDSFTTTNQPDYWGSAIVGVYGTDIKEESSTVYRSGGKCLRFVGTGGSPLSAIAQSLNQSSVAVGTSGTTSTLKPDTVYAFNCWARKSASAAAGVLKISLVDATPTVLADDAATDNSSTVAVGSLSSSAWTAFNGFFRTSKTITSTSTVKLRVSISTAITSGESIYVDDLTFCEATLAYTGGPYLALFAGETNFIGGDAFNVTVACDRAGDFQEYFDRVFGMKAYGFQLPSDTGGAETLADSLVT